MTNAPDPQHGALDWLTQRLLRLVAEATDALEQDPAQVQAWQDELSRQLARYHAASYLAGSGAAELAGPARAAVLADLATQLKFLGQFALEIQDAPEWQAGWNARAAMYARSIKIPFERGRTRMLPLPAMPAEGTQCLTNCGCFWSINELDGDGNADAYWVRAKNDSCQTCVQREADWSPVRIREGVLQL